MKIEECETIAEDEDNLYIITDSGDKITCPRRGNMPSSLYLMSYRARVARQDKEWCSVWCRKCGCGTGENQSFNPDCTCNCHGLRITMSGTSDTAGYIHHSWSGMEPIDFGGIVAFSDPIKTQYDLFKHLMECKECRHKYDAMMQGISEIVAHYKANEAIKPWPHQDYLFWGAGHE